MEREAVMSWWVDELERQLESTHHKFEDRAATVMGARAAKLFAAERATAAEWGLAVVAETAVGQVQHPALDKAAPSGPHAREGELRAGAAAGNTASAV